MTVRVIVLAALAVLVCAQENSTAPAPGGSFFLCNCPGVEAKDYVCGADGQVRYC